MIDDTSKVALTDGSRTHRLQHEGDGAVATTVVLAIAEIDGVAPTEMEPLYGTVDPGLLDALCRDDRQVTGDVMFNYRGHRVTVDSDGGIVVNPSATRDSN